jgi:hypothetical protein
MEYIKLLEEIKGIRSKDRKKWHSKEIRFAVQFLRGENSFYELDASRASGEQNPQTGRKQNPAGMWRMTI